MQPETPSDLSESSRNITCLLVRSSAGDRSAEAELYSSLYAELHRMASQRMGNQRGGVTLQPTALVNEAWLRISKSLPLDQDHFNDRRHFLRVASLAMRSTLVDEARRRQSQKRSAPACRVPLEVVVDVIQGRGVDLIQLNDVLERLGQDQPRQAKIVELRFFGGLTIGEVADTIGVSMATVERDWSLARMWLREELKPELN